MVADMDLDAVATLGYLTGTDAEDLPAVALLGYWVVAPVIYHSFIVREATPRYAVAEVGARYTLSETPPRYVLEEV